MSELVLFAVLSGLAILSAIGVVLNTRNTIFAALSLVVTMLSLAGLFMMLHAEFIGVLQVMIYAGAIVVLFLFVIMLLNLQGGEMGAERQPLLKLLGGALVVAAMIKLGGLLGVARLTHIEKGWPDVEPSFGTVANVGGELFTSYVLIFQIAGVLLLAGIVAAIVLAKQRID